jgi:hypothetical protein
MDRDKILDSCRKWLIMDMLTHGYAIKIDLEDMSTFKLYILRKVLPAAKAYRTIINYF